MAQATLWQAHTWGREQGSASLYDACDLLFWRRLMCQHQLVGRVCRWRRRSDHTDMRERQWRPQARRRAWGVHVDHDIYMPESMERVWSLARVERRRGATGERVVCGYSMSRNISETDLRVNRLGDLREGLFFGSLFRAQRGPRLVGVPEATMGPELHRRAYS